jgi:hypothetical protein
MGNFLVPHGRFLGGFPFLPVSSAESSADAHLESRDMSQVSHSRIGRFIVPLAVAGAVLVVTGLTIESSEAQTSALGKVRGEKVVRSFPHKTHDGQTFETRFDGKNFHAVTSSGAPLKDGDYKLDNGGAIKVRGGLVVWDAFGAVDVFKKTGLVKGISPDG